MKPMDLSTFPPRPTIESVDWRPPTETERKEVAITQKPVRINADSDNSGYHDVVWDVPGLPPNSLVINPRLINFWPGQGPAAHVLRLRQFWALVPFSYVTLGPGESFKKSFSYTHGVSMTDQHSITTQLGIEGKGFSLGLSETFSHSVTVIDEQTHTEEYGISGPDEGTLVWMLWDLRYELSVVNANTKDPIVYGPYRGDVDFTDDKHYSGAYLNYCWTMKTLSSGTLVRAEKVFSSVQEAAAKVK